jgi:hypothetical protein
VKAIRVYGEEKREVLELMAQDGHGVPDVTHSLVADDGEIVGAFSDEYMPVLWFWMRSNRWNPLACFRAFKLIEGMWHSRGHSRIVLPIQPESPFYQWVGHEKINFQHLGSGEIWIKKIRE